MNIISVDLPWNSETLGRRALAVADLDGNVKIEQVSDDNGLLELVHRNAELESIILLDVPIEGCQNLANLKGKCFRPVDIALARQGIGTLPSYRPGNRGKVLKERLEKNIKQITVQEIYPYAIYKFLAYLERTDALEYLNGDRFDALLNDEFRTYWPPKYKREREKDKRLKNMKYIYSLLTNTGLGLNFRTPLRHPDTSSNLGQLSDEYDACLGAIVGIYFANNNSYACVAGDSKVGCILLLADRWLSEQISREVKIDNLKEGSLRGA